jgi:hypothetical protein
VTDRLAGINERLSALEGAPIAAHPEVLEEVHRGLVAELDALAGAGAASPRTERR